MKNFILLLVLGSSLVGCASADKVTVPSGKWQVINQTGFIPATSKRYVEGVDITLDNNLGDSEVDDTEANNTEAVADSTQVI